MNFFITIYGSLDKDVADKLWTECEPARVNLTVLDQKAYIYGDSDDKTVNILAAAAAKTGFMVEVERG